MKIELCGYNGAQQGRFLQRETRDVIPGANHSVQTSSAAANIRTRDIKQSQNRPSCA